MTFETGVTFTVTKEMEHAWRGFTGRKWREDVNVREFIQSNYTMYDGDESFLEAPTEATDKLWGKLQELHHHSEHDRSYGISNQVEIHL